MSIGFSSAARNLFLLGSSGEQVVTNFFKTIDQSAGTDGVYLPDEIKYNFVDQKFVLAGSASDSNSKGFGWFEKRNQAGSAEWDVRVEAPSAGVNTTLRAMELDSNDNLIVVGKTADIPWIAKYSNGGVIDWQSTTNTADVEYTGITSDSNGNYYACGSTVLVEKTAFVEKFDTNGNPGWGKAAFMLGRDVVLYNIAANSRGEVVAVGYLEDNLYYKGYIVKIDTNTGEVLWDRTLETDAYLECTDVYIDSNDQIYVTVYKGNYFSATSYLIKYTAEGNIIWQRETNNDTSAGETIIYQQVHSDGETEQTVVFGTYKDGSGNEGGVLSKYSKDGSLVWRRTLFSTYNNSDSFGVLIKRGIALDADPSFYYLLFVDDVIDGFSGTPDRYTYGKVSSSGNGLGAFSYSPDAFDTLDYIILSVGDKIGRLSDGSVRQDTSDLITYPFNANKLLFDDLATQVSNKKRQMDDADSFEYSGSPAIRPADFQELNLLGDVYSGSGNWLDQSGKGNDGIASLTEPFFGAGGVSFDGTGDYLTVGGPLQTTNAGLDLGTNDFCIEYWVYQEVSTYASECFLFDLRETSNNTSTTAFIVNASNQLRWYWGNADRITVNNFIEQNQWTHHAFVRNGDVFTVYKNGTSAGSATIVGQNLGTVPTPCVIGAARSGGSPVQAKYSNFRITIEDPVYTGNFTPPTTPLTAITGTELLTCQGDTIADASANNFTITANGNAAPTDDGPTHNAAGYWEFDGVDDSISVPSDKINAMTTGDYSVEFWVYINSSQPDTGNGDNDLVEKWTDIDGYPFVFRYIRTTGRINAVIYGPPTSAGIDIPISTNTWNHVCGVFDRSSNLLTLYLNYTTTASINISGVTNSTTNNSDLFLMKRGSGINHAAGRFGELRIYPRALTAAQVFQNYNATREKYTGVPASTDPGLTSTRTPA